VQYVINNTCHTSTKTSPSKLLLGYDQRNHSDAELVKFFNRIINSSPDCDKVRNVARKAALESIQKVKDYNKVYFDKQHRKPMQYSPGDYVLIRDTTLKPGEDKKLKPNYHIKTRIW